MANRWLLMRHMWRINLRHFGGHYGTTRTLLSGGNWHRRRTAALSDLTPPQAAAPRAATPHSPPTPAP